LPHRPALVFALLFIARFSVDGPVGVDHLYQRHFLCREKTGIPMNELDSLKTAFARLERAVGRLERATDAREHRAATRDRDLQAQINDARIEQARAVALNEDLSRRLDAAIGRLESVVEN
jgi:hypothetical protein